MGWKVEYSSKAIKQLAKLPSAIQDAMLALVVDMEFAGPVRGDWPNFSKLSGGGAHCHLKKGRPTYVACWRVINKSNKLIEVYYVGTHEKAPY